jgi:phosphatidylglycerophosphate synthase
MHPSYDLVVLGIVFVIAVVMFIRSVSEAEQENNIVSSSDTGSTLIAIALCILAAYYWFKYVPAMLTYCLLGIVSFFFLVGVAGGGSD